MEKEANKWVTLNRGEYLVNLNDEIFKVFVVDGNNVNVNDTAYTFDIKKLKDDVYVLNLFNIKFEMTISDLYENKSAATSTRLSSKFLLNVNGIQMRATVDDQRSLVAQSWLLRKSHTSKSVTIKAPMPGLVTKVLVQNDMVVHRGGVFFILEAMKMENEIRALQECKIEKILVKPGTTVERNDELLKIIEL